MISKARIQLLVGVILFGLNEPPTQYKVIRSLFSTPLPLNHLRHVAVIDANHQRHCLLKHTEADEHDEGTEYIILPFAEIVADEIGYHQDADHQFQPSRCGTRSIETLHLEKTDSHRMHKALDDAKGSHNHYNHRHVVIEEWNH